MPEFNKIYQFDEFKLDVANKVLKKNGEVVALTPKVYDTLFVLLENAPNLVEKEELIQQIWQDLFVEENNLAFNIKRLRKVLGDDFNNPKFIETIPRRGYRFIAEVTEINELPKKNKESEPVPNKSRNFRKWQIIGTFVLVALVCSIGYAAWLWQKQFSQANAPILSNQYSLTKLSETGKVFHSAISPDGKVLAYTSKSGDKEGVWLRQMDSGANTELIPAAEITYYGLKFSPDGQTLFFTRNLPDKTLNLYKVSVYGGVPQKIIDNTQGGISFSPDGQKLVFIRYDQGVFEKNKLYIADIDGKNEKIIKESETPNVFWSFDFSPDGKTIAASYGRSNTGAKEMRLVEIDLENGQHKDISGKSFFNISSIRWLPNKSGLLLAAGEKINEPSHLWQVDYPSGKTSLLKNDSLSFDELDLTKDGKLLSGVTINPDFHLYLSTTDNPSVSRELAQARDEMFFTNDGRIVYASDAGGPEDIWIMNVDGNNKRQLTANKDLDAYPIVSADNRYIYFTSNRTGQMQVWRMNFDGTEQIQITLKDGGFPMLATADGKTLYYQKAQNFSIWRYSLENGEETQILPTKSKFYCAFSPEGDKIAFVAKNKEKGTFRIDVMNLADKSIIKSFQMGKNIPYYLSWIKDNSITYLTDDNNEKASLWQQKINQEKPLLITNTENDMMDCKFSPDGKSFAIIHGNWKHDAVLLNGLR